jgi:hypothetical protein
MPPVAMPAVVTFVSQFTSPACWQTHGQAMAKASIEVILSNANRLRRTNCDERSRGRPRDVTAEKSLNPAI